LTHFLPNAPKIAAGRPTPRSAGRRIFQEILMSKPLVSLTAAVTLGALILGPTAPARADSTGAAIAAGIGGFALGAMAGAAASAPPPVVYAPRPVFIEPAPVVVPRYHGYAHCWTEERPVFDEYGEVIGARPRRVCE
jgi:hypothetical protein